MTGLEIRSDTRFAEVFAPLLDRFATFYWLLDLVAGPFTYTDRPCDEIERIDRQMEALSIDVPELEWASASLWRPGILPRFAHLLWEDEWGYFLAFTGSEPAAIRRAASLPSTAPPSCSERFRDLVGNAEIYIVQVDSDLWHVFSKHHELLEALREAHPSAVAVSSNVYARASS